MYVMSLSVACGNIPFHAEKRWLETFKNLTSKFETDTKPIFKVESKEG